MDDLGFGVRSVLDELVKMIEMSRIEQGLLLVKLVRNAVNLMEMTFSENIESNVR